MVGVLELAAAWLLAAAGLAKLGAPAEAAAMLRRAIPPLRSLRSLRLLVRLGAVAELAVAAAVVSAGGRIAGALLAACYLAFAAVSVRLARLPSDASCGCFGRAASPVGGWHVAVNLGFAAAALAGVADPLGPVGGLFDGSALRGVIGLGQSVLLAYLAFLALTALPALAAERRRLLESVV